MKAQQIASIPKERLLKAITAAEEAGTLSKNMFSKNNGSKREIRKTELIGFCQIYKRCKFVFVPVLVQSNIISGSLEGSEVEEVAQGDILVDEWPVDADTAFDNKPVIALLGGSLGAGEGRIRGRRRVCGCLIV
jgi:hypothetical protein